MSLLPINTRQSVPHKDTMDQILQGLQIANEVFKIPVAYEQFRSGRADADVKGAEADSIENLKNNKVDPYAIIKNKLMPVPQSASSLLPPPAPGQTIPPETQQKPSLIPGAFDASDDGGKPKQYISQEAYQKYNDVIKERANQADEVAKRYDAPNTAIDSIQRLKEKALAGNGPAQFQLMKAFNQFNDTPRFTEGEAAVLKSTQGLLGSVAQTLQNWKNGTVLSNPVIQKIIDATEDIKGAYYEGQKNALSPAYQDAKAMNLPLERILRPNQLGLFSPAPEKPQQPGRPQAPAGPSLEQLLAERARRKGASKNGRP